MADRSPESGTVDWKEVEKKVTCSICNSPFVEPKTISCLHTFCEKCIQITMNNSDSRDCPICGTELAFPQDHAKIPTNRLLQYRASIVSKIKEGRCGECELAIDDAASTVMWCVDCDNFLCKRCSDAHKEMKSLKSHKTMTIEQFYAQSPDTIFAHQSDYSTCKDHSKPNKPRPLDFYCKTCNTLICQMCIMTGHRQHHYDLVNKVVDEERDKIKLLVTPLKTILDCEVAVAMKKMEDVDNELNNETDAKRQVQDMYHQLHELLDQCEVRDLQKIEAVKTGLQNSLGSQKEKLKVLHTCMASCNEFVSKVVMPAREITQLHGYIAYTQERVKDLTNQVEQSSLEPVCGVDHMILSTSNPNDYASHFTSLCTVSTLPHVPNCSVKGPSGMSKYAPVNVIITLKDEDGRPVPNQTEHLTVHFEDENIASNMKKEEVSKGVYVLSYKAKKRETHGLSVSWKGKDLGETTVRAKVRQYSDIKKPLQDPITKYGKMNLISPHLMALGPDDELIVRDCHTNSLVVFDVDLKFSRIIAVDKSPPTGLAVSNGYLYMSTDHAIKKIQMDDGKAVFTFGKKGTEDGRFHSPRGLVINKNGLLYVCDRDNHRIQVLQENHFQFSFGKHGKQPGTFSHPYDLTFNNTEDLLFITDSSNHRIQLFTPTGQFLKLFGNLTNIPGKLRYPTGICYTPDDHVLICSSNSHYMLIFKQDDSFVSIVAIEGTEDGKQAYTDPVGVVMKNDGRIIVAGCNTNKLVVF